MPLASTKYKYSANFNTAARCYSIMKIFSFSILCVFAGKLKIAMTTLGQNITPSATK